ncbi:MAG: signal peptide peptidase SppA [Alistipes sp.]|nr:signal peptide peptidase SppA [Alistipes sp.]
MDFLKTLGASLLAWIIGFGLLIFGTIAIIVGAVVSMVPEDKVTTSGDSVLYFNLSSPIIDSPMTSIFSSFEYSIDGEEPVTMLQSLAALERAAEDDNIKGICINISGDSTPSLANIEELRLALLKFKQSGKFIVAFDDAYTQSEYYLSSVADKIIINPEGSLEWRGAGMSSTFYKNMLDKLDISVYIFRPTACKYKSAVEPFFLTKMSEANRKQCEELVNSLWNSICEDVSQSRGIEVAKLKNYANNLSIVFPEDALSAGMVDMIAYEDGLYELYKEYGVKENSLGLVNTISFGKYVQSLGLTNYTSTTSSNNYSQISSPMVAIIYADGQIVDGNAYEDGSVYGTRLAHELRAARLDDKTKAVVVRVNSPGGSALASEVAWHEMSLLQQAKPVVISMGDMAASGGYYISAPADYIFADRSTLTGSIGVFGIVPKLGGMFEKKLGITFDSAATSPSAAGLIGIEPLSKEECNFFNKSIDRVYTTFVNHVAEGRNLETDYVYTIAEGRVWSGAMAKEIGLVDEIGGINMAIAKAAEMADIVADFKIYEFVAPLTPFEEWINSMSMVYAKKWGVDYNIFGDEIRNIISELPIITSMDGIKTQLYGDLKIEF